MSIPVIVEGIQDILDMNARFRFSIDAEDALKEECVGIFPQADKLQKSPEIAAYGNITPILIRGPQPAIEDAESKDARDIGNPKSHGAAVQFLEPIHQRLASREVIEDTHKEFGLDLVRNPLQEPGDGLMERMV